jgi:hypothetical protein
MHSVGVVVKLHVTVNYIKILSFAQQCFYRDCHRQQCNLYVTFCVSLTVHCLQFTVYKPTKCTSLSLLLSIRQPLHMFRSYIRPSSGRSQTAFTLHPMFRLSSQLL